MPVDKSEQERNEKFLELLGPNYQGFFAYARYLTGSLENAEDLMQSSSLRALKYLDQLKDDKKFKSWFYRIIHNTYRNQARRKEYRSQVDIEDEIIERYSHQQTDYGDLSDKVVNKVHLDQALQKLPPHLRETLLLFEREGFSIAEIAKMMKRSQSAIKHRLRSARDQLRIHYFSSLSDIEERNKKEKNLVTDET